MKGLVQNVLARLPKAFGRHGPGWRSHDFYRDLGECVGAVRLNLRVDAESIAEEIREVVGKPRNLVQADVDSIVLRKGGKVPSDHRYQLHHSWSHYDDTPELDSMPLLAETTHGLLPAKPCLALLAKLNPRGVITVHSDEFRYFSSTFRIHLPIVTNRDTYVWSFGKAYQMKAGEVWAINNMALHGGANLSHSEPRSHVICDYVPTPELIELIRDGDASLGREHSELTQAVFKETERRFSRDTRRYYLRRLGRELSGASPRMFLPA